MFIVEVLTVTFNLRCPQRVFWPRWTPARVVTLWHCFVVTLTHMGIYQLTEPII